jgi:pimeloyl-ACP methyl ester carboxylesterase
MRKQGVTFDSTARNSHAWQWLRLFATLTCICGVADNGGAEDGDHARSAQLFRGSWTTTIRLGDEGETEQVLKLHLGERGQPGSSWLSSPSWGRTRWPVAVAIDSNPPVVRLRLLASGMSSAPELVLAGKETLEGTYTTDSGAIHVRFLQEDGARNATDTTFDDLTQSVEVQVADSVTLSGSLMLPAGREACPCVVILTGSGADSRDGPIPGTTERQTPYFQDVADVLLQKGIGSLRLDDRGIGLSGGSVHTATLSKLAADAEAAIDVLRRNERIDKGRLGLLGFSQGALVAGMVAAKRADVRFVAVVGCPTLSGIDYYVNRFEAITMPRIKSTYPEDLPQAVGTACNNVRHLLELVRDGQPPELAKQQFLQEIKLDPSSLAEEDGRLLANVLRLADLLSRPDNRSHLQYDPAPDWRKVKIPVFAAYGEKETVVPVAENKGCLERCFPGERGSLLTTRIFAGLNHGLERGVGEQMNDAATTIQSVDKASVSVIADWMVAEDKREEQKGRRI